MLIFYYLVFSQKRLKAWDHFGSFLLGYGVIRFLIEFLREPDAFFITNENPYGYVIEFFPYRHINGSTAHSSNDYFWTFNDPFGD